MFTEGHRAIDEVSNVSRRVTSLSVPISLRLDRLKRELHPSIDVLSLCRAPDCDPTFSPPVAPTYVMTKDKGQARVRAPRGDNVYGRLRDFQVWSGNLFHGCRMSRRGSALALLIYARPVRK